MEAPVRHILHATDFSPHAMVAARAANQLAARFSAKVTLFNSYPPSAARGEALAKEAHERLETLASERFAGREVELTAVPAETPSVAITGHAMACGTDLVVVGRHGSGAEPDRFIGTTGERVVRHAPCSALVVDQVRPQALIAPKHFLVGTDFSDESLRALKMASAWAGGSDTWVTLVHVHDLIPPLAVLQKERSEDEDNSIAATMTRELEGMRGEHLEGIPSSSELLRHKSTVAALCDFASERDSDLLLLATHGRSGVARLLLGSVAERCVRHAPCSVLVVR
jgi:nucleotide-binding universal stress UspA family protein